MFFLVVTKSISWGTYVGQFFLPSLLGNVVGGLALVAALGHAQVVAGEGWISSSPSRWKPAWRIIPLTEYSLQIILRKWRGKLNSPMSSRLGGIRFQKASRKKLALKLISLRSEAPRYPVPTRM
jgi:hypothetical protein